LQYIKLAYRVPFPLELRLFNTSDDADDPDKLYELFGIVVHIGVSPHHGHYISIVKIGGQWVQFDDQNVSIIDEASISKFYGDMPSIGSAYVLFYQAKDMNTQALGLSTPESSTQYVTIPPQRLSHMLNATDEASRADAQEKEGKSWIGSFKKDRRQPSSASVIAPPKTLDLPSSSLRPTSAAGAGSGGTNVEHDIDAASISTHTSSISNQLANMVSRPTRKGSGSKSRDTSRERMTSSNSSHLLAPSTTFTPNTSRTDTLDGRISNGSPTKGDSLTSSRILPVESSPFNSHTRVISAEPPFVQADAPTRDDLGKKSKRSSLALSSPIRKSSLASKLGFGKKS
jgi:Ubiquitin carboxyl-terminal hydrolase